VNAVGACSDLAAAAVGRAARASIDSPLMPQPLPDAVVATLRTDACAALAAIMIISNAHSELLAWAQRALGGNPPRRAADGEEDAKANGAGGGKGVAKSDRAKKGARAKGPHNPSVGAAKHDQALLALMRANPDANVTEIIRMNGRPRNSTVLSLERLEKAGLVEHAARGKWTVADLLEVPAPKPAAWIEPVSGSRVARHAADGRVRNEMTLA
jgi:hypothetical protein